MQKGSIHMEPITIKARLNQAYHFSGQPETASAFPIFRTVRLSFSVRTHRLCNTTVLSLQVHQLRVPVRLTRDALPYLLFLYVESGSGTLTNAGDAAAEPVSLRRGSLCFFRIRPHTGFPMTHTFCYHCFICRQFSEYLPFLCADGSIFHMSRTEVDDIVWRILPYLSASCSDEPGPRFI